MLQRMNRCLQRLTRVTANVLGGREGTARVGQTFAHSGDIEGLTLCSADEDALGCLTAMARADVAIGLYERWFAKRLDLSEVEPKA
jgi:hypothetical protein